MTSNDWSVSDPLLVLMFYTCFCCHLARKGVIYIYLYIYIYSWFYLNCGPKKILYDTDYAGSSNLGFSSCITVRKKTSMFWNPITLVGPFLRICKDTLFWFATFVIWLISNLLSVILLLKMEFQSCNLCRLFLHMRSPVVIGGKPNSLSTQL